VSVEPETLAALEDAAEDGLDVSPVLAQLAAGSVDFTEDERKGAVRRAVLLLAAGGDPYRELELDGRAVTALADDLDGPGRRAALAAGLSALPLEGLPRLGEAVAALLADDALAWRRLAVALLADELAGEH
jgi:hypothetical protein